MSSTLRRLLDVRTTLAELVLIVIGVFIALAIDSWWDRTQERQAEIAHMESLQADFESNRSLLEATLRGLDDIKADVRVLLEIIEGQRSVPSGDSLTALTWSAFSFENYEPVTTAYDNLVTTNGIQLLRDGELGADLALFRRQVELYHRQDWQLDQWNRMNQPFVNRRMKGLDWLPPSYRAEHGLPEPQTRTDWATLLQDPEFEGVIVNRYIAANDATRNLQGLQPTVDRIVTRLEALLEPSQDR